MPRAGRRRSVVWACFVENVASGKRRVLCRFCQHDLVANPIRMVRHIVKHCPSADEQHKKICREYQALTVPLRRRGDADAEGDGEGEGDALHHDSDAAYAQEANALALPQQQLPHHQHQALHASVSPAVAMSFALATHAVAHFPLEPSTPSPAPAQPDSADAHHRSPALDDSVVEHVHEQLALALATTEGPAMRLLENPRFTKALELVNVPPLTATEIDGRVVPRLRDRLEADAMAALRSATTITLQLTTVTPVPDPGTVGIHVFASDQDHRQVPLGTISATSEIELTALIRSRIRDVPRKPQCQLHVCTDAWAVTPSVIAALNDDTQSAESSQVAPVFVTGCLMQASLSLLANVVKSTPRLRQAVDACAHVSESIAADDSLWSHLQSQRDCTNAISVVHLDDTRLWSLLAVVDQVLQLRRVLRGTAPSGLQPIVTDDQFWRDAALAQDLLRPFGFLLALSEASHLNSSMVLTSWLLVWATARRSQVLADTEKQTIASVVLVHIQCHASSALVCLALDPRCRGVALTALGKRQVRTMGFATAQKLNPHVNHAALLEQVVKYLNGERPFDDEASWQMMASLPRLFWVEYAAEAPELAAVALAALSLRPFIHSLERTWELMLPESGRKDDPAVARLKKIAFGLDLMDRQASDRRKQSLTVAARLLVPDADDSVSAVEETSTVDSGVADQPSFATALPADSVAHAFWSRLAHVAEAYSQHGGIRGSATTDVRVDIDATWFAVDASDAVAQLQSSLHRALFGEYADLRVPTAAQHCDATEDAATAVASAVVSATSAASPTSAEESTPEMLSGFVGL